MAMRAWLGAALLLAAGLAWVGCPPAVAQTAHAGGQITLPVSNYFSELGGVAVDKSGNVFVSDRDTGLFEIPYTSGAYGTPVWIDHATVQFAYGVALDGSGNLFASGVDDAFQYQLWEIAYTSGSYSSTPTLLGGSSFIYPQGVALDGNGNLFVTDLGSGHRGVWELASGQYSSTPTRIGDSSFNLPQGVAIDGSGNAFVADIGSHIGVWKIAYSSGSYTTTETQVGSFSFAFPSGIAVDISNNLFVTDLDSGILYEMTAASGYSTVVTLSSSVSGPMGVALDASGDIYVANLASPIAIYKLIPASVNFGTHAVGSTSTQQIAFTFDTGGQSRGVNVLTQGASGLDFTDAETGTCYTNGTSYTYSAGDTCTVVVKFKPTLPGQRLGAVQLLNSSGTAVIATENVYGTGTGPMVTFPSNRTVNTVGSGLFSGPQGVTLDGSGNVIVADTNHNAVKELVAPGYTTVNLLGSGFNHPCFL